MAPFLWSLSALATSSSSSPWAPAEWRINLNIGREPGTYMPESWGASGARLSLSTEVLIEPESVDDDFLGAGADRISVLDDPVFVTSDGEQTVRLGDEGAWKLSTRRSGKLGDACQLRLWLDVLDEAVRNDVRIDANERLYMSTNCWRENELAQGLRRMQPIQAALDEAQAAIDDRLSHESGDRRLDGTNPVETAKASFDMAVLVKARDDRLFEFRDAEQKLPSKADLSKPGRWPGTTDLLAITKGKVAVRRKQLFGGDQFHIVGTWSVSPLEGLSEFYEENELEASPPTAEE